MKAIILAAGYATRLYPLTKDRPKPLLQVKGRPIVEHIISKIGDIDDIDTVFIVTNNRFFEIFNGWNKNFECSKKIVIVNDETLTNEDRLGSLGDINFVIQKNKLDDDIMVVAGDNLFEFSLRPMVEIFRDKNNSVVALYDVKDKVLAKQYGIVAVDSDNKIVDFEEKPKEPKSTLSSTGVYIYPKDVVYHLLDFVKNHNADKAGDFLQWLYTKKDIYCYITDKKWFDIGTVDQLEKARNEFEG